jgi:hypothetical protein
LHEFVQSISPKLLELERELVRTAEARRQPHPLPSADFLVPLQLRKRARVAST